jgi:peptidoglycan/xylan/chitin deacetylase (PgdA/CDA1 family)
VDIFASQVEYIARRYRVEPLQDVADWLASGAPGPARVALTIDDGYPDTHDSVLPILCRLGLPATLFLATAPPETGRVLWLDRVRHLVKHARARHVELASGSGPLILDSKEAKLRTLRSLLRRMKRMEPSQIESTLAHLDEQIGEGVPEPRPIGWDQARALARGQVDLGAHTHRHFLLSTLDDATLAREVTTSMDLIEERVGARPVTFAYPNGEVGDFDDRAKCLLRNLGVHASVTTESGLATPDQDVHALPRVYSTEHYLPLFAARLSGFGREVA